MGKAARPKTLKKPQKIRERSDEEIKAVVIAYQKLYTISPFVANMMLLCSELSEYNQMPPLDDEKKMDDFIKENQEGLVVQFVRRFSSVDVYAIPRVLN